MSLCLSGADSSHKHQNSTPCVMVSRGRRPATFWHLTNCVYREWRNLLAPLRLFDKLPAHFIILSSCSRGAKHLHYCPSSTSHSNLHIRPCMLVLNETPDLLGHVKNSSPERFPPNMAAPKLKMLTHFCSVVCKSAEPSARTPKAWTHTSAGIKQSPRC